MSKPNKPAEPSPEVVPMQDTGVCSVQQNATKHKETIAMGNNNAVQERRTVALVQAVHAYSLMITKDAATVDAIVEAAAKFDKFLSGTGNLLEGGN